jgi:hypothetical protein
MVRLFHAMSPLRLVLIALVMAVGAVPAQAERHVGAGATTGHRAAGARIWIDARIVRVRPSAWLVGVEMAEPPNRQARSSSLRPYPEGRLRLDLSRAKLTVEDRDGDADGDVADLRKGDRVSALIRWRKGTPRTRVPTVDLILRSP